MMCSRRVIKGFGMIEVLVALVILLVSVLGLAGLAVRTTQQETESYQRVQALILLQDMVDRLNANRKVISCYSNDANGITVGTGFASTIPACTGGTLTQNTQAVTDLTEWSTSLQGAAQKTSTNNNSGAVIGARGCIVQVDATEKIYRVTVAWQGLGKTVAPNSTCGQNSYGDEALRRTVNAIVHIGKLS
jgi:type IV pilus assembly protein PilV